MSEIKPETQSNWECVSDQLKNYPPLTLGEKTSEWFYNTPKQLLNFLTHYKFASKMIGKGKKVLDISCKEGMGTYLIAKECGFAKGIDLDSKAIETARANFFGEDIIFEQGNFLDLPIVETWDAVISFGAASATSYLKTLLNSAAQYVSKQGIVILSLSCKTGESLLSESDLTSIIHSHFIHSFFFSSYGELIQAGYSPSADEMIIMGCKKRLTL